MLEEHSEAELLRLYLPYRSLMDVARRQGRSCLAGQLLLTSCAEQAAGGRLAGGAVLLALANASEGRAALRAGYCDFLVTDLDEAVRILRNEVRRKAAIAVCLQMEAAPLMQVCVERGIQPDLVDAPVAALETRGARTVAWQKSLGPHEMLVHWTAGAAFMRDLPGFDRIAEELLPREDRERRRWLRQAPSMLGRRWQRMRGVPMCANELKQLLHRLNQEPPGEACAVWNSTMQVWPINSGQNDGATA